MKIFLIYRCRDKINSYNYAYILILFWLPKNRRKRNTVTPIVLGITLNGTVIPESIAIVTPAAAEEYWHVSTTVSVTVPCGCCVTVSGAYVDGTEDDPATTPTPSIQVRREASLDVKRIA